jgi:hypothetical protein
MILFLHEEFDGGASKSVVQFANDLLSHLKTAARLVKSGKINNTRQMGIFSRDNKRQHVQSVNIHVNSTYRQSLKTSLFEDSFRIYFATYADDYNESRTHYSTDNGNITIEHPNPMNLLDIEEVGMAFYDRRQSLYHELSHKLDVDLHPEKYISPFDDNYTKREYVNQRSELFALYNEIISYLRKTIDNDVDTMFKNQDASEKEIAVAFKNELAKGIEFYDVYLIANSIIADNKKFLNLFRYKMIDKDEKGNWDVSDENKKKLKSKALKDFDILQAEYQKEISEKIRKLT